MTVREAAREAQQAHFEKHPDLGTEEVQAVTTALYDSIDSLSPEQHTLLISNAIHKVMELCDGELDPGPGVAVRTILAIAGYANETEREDAGYTSTGDRKVDATLDLVRELITASLSAYIDPERRGAIAEATARVKARVDAGEDFDLVAEEEARALHFDHAVPETVNAKTGKDDLKGMYL